MPVLFQVRTADSSARANIPKWVVVQKKGKSFQDPGSGRIIEVFRIGVFSQAINRDAITVRGLIREGHFPKPLYSVQDAQCKWWFSAEQVINCHRIYLGKYKGQKYFWRKGGDAQFASFCTDIRAVWYHDKVVINEAGEYINDPR